MEKDKQDKPTLLQLRIQKRWPQAQVAKLAGVTKASISKAESGQIPMTRQTLEDICDVYGVSIDQVSGLNVSERVYIRARKVS
jgi:transcriptional regulator with XRE-family HTH domain